MEEYLYSDLEDIYYGRKTFESVAKKYNSSPKNVKRAFYRRGFILNKRYFVIVNKVSGEKFQAYTVADCCKILNVSRQTIYSAIKGKKIKLFDELKIELEVHYSGEEEKKKRSNND